MHTSEAQRIGEIAAPVDGKPQPLPEHLLNLPSDTHIVSGTLDGHGSVALASEAAKLSGKIVKLVRTSSGGIEYQLALFVSEPAVDTTVPVAVDETREAAIKYFTDEGMSREKAITQVDHFGVARVNAMRDKKLDEDLANQRWKDSQAAQTNEVRPGFRTPGRLVE